MASNLVYRNNDQISLLTNLLYSLKDSIESSMPLETSPDIFTEIRKVFFTQGSIHSFA